MSTITLITLPIGNKDDITLRALNALKEMKVFYAEDTRVFKELLKSYSISYLDKEIDSFHDHSTNKIDRIIEKVKAGTDIALVSDAGSPVISDPAYPLLRKAIQEGIGINSFPGVTSLVAALELSGLPSNPFHFWGFLSRTQSEKKKKWEEVAVIPGTHLFYESPHRIADTVNSFFEVLPEQELVIARELTKKFQEVIRIKKCDKDQLERMLIEKGEFVILFHSEGVGNSQISPDLKSDVNDYLENGGSPKKLAKIFSKILDLDTREIYSKMVQSK